MFTEDDLLDIHFGIHGDARAIQTRFGFIPIENRPVKFGGVVRCVSNFMNYLKMKPLLSCLIFMEKKKTVTLFLFKLTLLR